MEKVRLGQLFRTSPMISNGTIFRSFAYRPLSFNSLCCGLFSNESVRKSYSEYGRASVASNDEGDVGWLCSGRGRQTV